MGAAILHTRLALVVLLSIDALLIITFFALEAADQRGAIATVPDLLKINARESVGTLLLFLKFLLGAVVLYLAGRRADAAWPKEIALVFFLLWFDDWGEVHEFFGDVVANMLSLGALGPLDPDDIGEVIYLVPFAVLCFGLLFHALRQAPPHARGAVAWLIGLLAGLAFFGVGADLIARAADHMKTERLFDPHLVTSVFEDGGEMVMGSLMLWQAARIGHRIRPAPAFVPARAAGRGEEAD